ncbi:PTS fructose transporter subunit IIB [Tractidigestivibacter scatoligenes]|uniref:PTS fructose transporter subunit IIB n=1 Tax=Tractidigestivibacter scatoligenes TaxID=1299998 RepID=A0A124EH09_TRASO|nr:PTS fructose transporter subunit IIB [Tractidigestivibacter scatoligenes]KUH59157.1 PTS fructose transporter subunit IIB [Tractidigestivibacter scatoligenes]
MYVIGVTSCATGIAHTYMAANAIRKACKKRGYKVKVETQGAVGVEHRLTEENIKAADLIVFANDVQITDMGRFKGYEDKIKRITPDGVIRNPDSIFD